jgi:hypothetical protein
MSIFLFSSLILRFFPFYTKKKRVSNVLSSISISYERHLLLKEVSKQLSEISCDAGR